MKAPISEVRMLAMLHRAVKELGGLRKAAKAMRCSPSTLAMALAGERPATKDMARYLGVVRRIVIRREVTYHRNGKGKR